jgi:hypothetical protein
MTTYRFPHSPVNLASRGITGRDGYIVAECLYRYIATESAKPDHEQSWSNLQDARAIFNAFCGEQNAVFFANEYPAVSLVDEKSPRVRVD